MENDKTISSRDAEALGFVTARTAPARRSSLVRPASLPATQGERGGRPVPARPPGRASAEPFRVGNEFPRSLHGANRGGFEPAKQRSGSAAHCGGKNLGDSTEGKRGAAVFGRNREGPPAKRPKSFPNPKRMSAGRTSRKFIREGGSGRRIFWEKRAER